MLSEGAVDVHSHLLPGIDDGCASLDDSLRCIEQLRLRGYEGTICTPHVCVAEYPHITPEFVEQRVALLRQELEARDINYSLWTGGEVRLSGRTIEFFETYGVPTLGESRCVLVDTWDRDWPAAAVTALEYLLERDYRPVLAHPERMPLSETAWSRVMETLQELGVPLQGNLRCLAGHEGLVPQMRMQRLLREQRYVLVATDMHHPHCLPDRLSGIDCLAQAIGAKAGRKLLVEHPTGVASGRLQEISSESGSLLDN